MYDVCLRLCKHQTLFYNLIFRFDRTELEKTSKYLKNSDYANSCSIRFGSRKEKNSRLTLYSFEDLRY
jgi:hypothetical protein